MNSAGSGTSLLDRLQAALGDRYSIVRELGRGGMATVFLAADRRHGRQVAIKVVHPGFAIVPAATERFQREIGIAASLNHPNIVTLFDSGEADGLHYYVMPFIDGESLRDRLNREGQLPVEDAIAIARDVAAALQHAHTKSLIHRDIKPENIMLSGKTGLVTDFGIARPTDSGGDAHLTSTGVVVGTPTYMSPEQATGGRDLDGRSDLYSLGCVLYEMLVGHPPFQGRNSLEVVTRHALDPVPPAQSGRPIISDQLEATLQRLLTKNPVDRFGSGDQLIAALDEVVRLGATTGTAGPRLTTVASLPRRRWAPAAIGTLVAVGAVAAALWFRRAGPRTASNQPIRIAVLPLRNIGLPDESHFAEGLTEEITFRLARLPNLAVVARNSGIQSGQGRDLKDIGRDLEVDYLIEGTVQWGEEKGQRRVRIFPSLIRVATGDVVQTNQFNGVLEDVFDLQARVAQTVAEQLPIALGSREKTSLKTPASTNFEAYQEYTLGRTLWQQRTAEGLAGAVQHFDNALRKDPLFARAYSGLADAYVLFNQYGVSQIGAAEAWTRARSAAERALALDSTLAEAHASLGEVLLYSDWNWAGSEAHFREAIRHDPSYATARQWYAELLALTGRGDEAVIQGKSALQLDPVSPAANNALAMGYSAARNYDEAIGQFGRVRQLVASLGRAGASSGRDQLLIGYAIFGSAFGYIGKGDYARAIDQMAQLGDTSAFTKLWIKAAIDSSSRPAARRALARYQERLRAYPSELKAEIYAAVGDATNSVAVLRAMIAEHSAVVPGVMIVNLYDPIRADTGFQAVLRELKLRP